MAFGESETRKAIHDEPRIKGRLLGLSLWSLLGIDVLARAVARRSSDGHPVLEQFPAFLRHVRTSTELRLERLGILEKSISEMGFLLRSGKMGLAAVGHMARRLLPGRRPRLTKTYLEDRRLCRSGLPG